MSTRYYLRIKVAEKDFSSETIEHSSEVRRVYSDLIKEGHNPEVHRIHGKHDEIIGIAALSELEKTAR